MMLRRTAALVLPLTAALGLSACSVGKDEPDLVAGKKAFVQKCGSCHILNRAGTKGNAGPNLDESFTQAISAGMGRNGIESFVEEWIQHPARFKYSSRGKDESIMPADLVTGDALTDVSAYVASTVSRSGDDTGLLATAVKQAGSGPAVEAEGGKLSIPADPSGQLAYTSSKATAPAGALSIESPNESGVPHNIAIEGLGAGEVVENGVSSFKATLKAGETYEYICTVPGHEEAGMKGELTVE